MLQINALAHRVLHGHLISWQSPDTILPSGLGWGGETGETAVASGILRLSPWNALLNYPQGNER